MLNQSVVAWELGLPRSDEKVPSQKVRYRQAILNHETRLPATSIPFGSLAHELTVAHHLTKMLLFNRCHFVKVDQLLIVRCRVMDFFVVPH